MEHGTSLNAYDALRDRGFIKQETRFEEHVSGESSAGPANKISKSIRELLASTQVTYYVGFDATADSLHIGSLMPIMAMSWLQKAGHVPVCIIGGGTTMIGDPSGKTQMRQMLTKETIDVNGVGILRQLKRYLDISEEKGQFLDNADWLMPLNYVDFLRDFGRFFKVNEMIKTDAYKRRLEREEGLSFIEFNYQLLQAYDFLLLHEKYGCVLQMGGDDQWSNILAGIDLIRRVKRRGACGMTFPLLTTVRGQKMGKTESGAVWLDPAKTSPYEYFQYWVNADDRDVERFLKYFTFLSLAEIEELCARPGSDLRQARLRLAYEATKITHGTGEAEKAQSASKRLFAREGGGTDIPTTSLQKAEVVGMKVTELLVKTGLCSSKSDAARLIRGGGLYVNNVKFEDGNSAVESVLDLDGRVLIRKGKKTYHQVVVN